MEKCESCGTTLRRFEYQSRAADEAHRIVIVCPSCPLDPRNFGDSSTCIDRRALFRTPKPGGMLYARPEVFRHIGHASVMRVDIDAETFESITAPSSAIVFRRCSVNDADISSVPVPGEVYGDAPMTDHVYVRVSEVSRAPGCTVSNFRLYRTSSAARDLPVVHGGMFKSIHTTEIFAACAVAVRRGRLVEHFLQYTFIGMATGRVIRGMLLDAYSRRGAPSSLTRYLGNGTFDALRNLCSRAWDVKSVNEPGYVFLQKVDGERRWLFICGSIAFLTRVERTLTVVSWYEDLGQDTAWNGKYIAVDCEYMPHSGLTFIDMLTDVHGNLSPPNRSLLWSVETFGELRRLKRLDFVYVRDFSESAAEVTERHGLFREPTDGVVAIHLSSTAARKIKDTKSIELKVKDTSHGFVMVTADEVELFPGIAPQCEVIDGDIVEVRFTRESDSADVKIMSMFRRVDKSKANDTNAAANILYSANILRVGDENDRRLALVWCNSLRLEMNLRAAAMVSNQYIILDIGSGDGQSLSSMGIHDDRVSRILVEPDRDKCSSMCFKLKCRLPEYGSAHVRSAVRGLKTRRTPHIVANCTFGELLADSELCDILMPEVRCVITTFSAHFVIHDLSMCFAMWRIPVLGCGYVYDDVDVGKSLVDACGVTMKRVSDKECMVSWGRDREYVEPYTRSIDYRSFCNVVRASGIMTRRSEQSGPFMQICSKVVCFTPRI